MAKQSFKISLMERKGESPEQRQQAEKKAEQLIQDNLNHFKTHKKFLFRASDFISKLYEITRDRKIQNA